ncbi:hypothetical protein FB566_1223 [Stackebrandtia endophytica]|uniref:Uncharacterized protein n=1 Tax=Stackebrandtia endophytica TaxID=1496996 RepID=A0A543ASZ9_9ACTN|nr:hypothetical protein FB566_1223 [Stackebrandtia endophytica]
MGLLRWMRGGDDNNDASVAGMSTGLAEIEAIFMPSKRKQTELIEEQSISRFDAETGEPLNMIDLDGGTALVHSTGQVMIDVADDGLGDELDGDGGKQKAGDAGQHLDAAAFDKSHDD